MFNQVLQAFIWCISLSDAAVNKILKLELNSNNSEF